MRLPFPLFLLLVFLYSCDKPGPIFPLDYANYTTEDPIPSDFRIWPGEGLLYEVHFLFFTDRSDYRG
jgi:hypothetical protein